MIINFTYFASVTVRTGLNDSDLYEDIDINYNHFLSRLSYGPAKDKETIFTVETSANSVTLQNLTSNTQYILYLTTLKVRECQIF